MKQLLYKVAGGLGLGLAVTLASAAGASASSGSDHYRSSGYDQQRYDHKDYKTYKSDYNSYKKDYNRYNTEYKTVSYHPVYKTYNTYTSSCYSSCGYQNCYKPIRSYSNNYCQHQTNCYQNHY
ncbi:MAG TPA: hypothetical protein VI322_05730 [Candidatus Saccharimonadia bacterium]